MISRSLPVESGAMSNVVSRLSLWSVRTRSVLPALALLTTMTPLVFPEMMT